MGQEIPFEAVTDPTYKKYNLKGILRFRTVNIDEDIGKGRRAQATRKLSYLVLEETDEMIRFVGAWVPDTVSEHFELTAYIKGPVHSAVRLAVFRGHDGKFDRPYVFIMTKAVEDILVKFKEGTPLLFVTNAANEDAEADNVDVSDGNFDHV